MAVKIRLSRLGKKHAPVYRIVAVDSRAKRDGKFIENLGTYNPISHKLEQWHEDRIGYWLSQGAQMTDGVKRLEKMRKKGEFESGVVAKAKVAAKAKVEVAKAKATEAPVKAKDEEATTQVAAEETTA